MDKELDAEELVDRGFTLEKILNYSSSPWSIIDYFRTLKKRINEHLVEDWEIVPCKELRGPYYEVYVKLFKK